MVFSVVVQMVSLVIHLSDAIYHYNDAIHCVNAMNLDNIVLKVVQLIRNVHAVKFVQLENVEIDAIQALIVWKDNCVKMVHVLLVVEIIWIVQVIVRV